MDFMSNIKERSNDTENKDMRIGKIIGC